LREYHRDAARWQGDGASLRHSRRVDVVPKSSGTLRMMKRNRSMWIGFALALAGCGPAATHPATGNSVAGGSGVSHPAATPCPADIGAAALTSWGKTAGTAEASCVALWSEGHTVWLFDGIWEPPESDDSYTVGMWTSVTTDAGQVLWSDGSDDMPLGAAERSGTTDYKAIDFDGDGNDELLFESDYDHGGYSESSLSAASVRDGKLQVGASLPLSSDNSAAEEDPESTYSCAGEYAVIDGPDGTKQVAITGSGDASDGCALPGRHVYRWNGATLVEVGTGS
jgi:hypothetical protein